MGTSFGTELLATLACLGVFVVAFLKTIRPGSLVTFAFVTYLLSSAFLFVSPEPSGYPEDLVEGRHGIVAMEKLGPRLSGTLLAASLTSLVCAAGFRRTPKEPT